MSSWWILEQPANRGLRLEQGRNRTTIVPFLIRGNLTDHVLMSRAFVKDGDFLEQLPERLVSGHPNDVSEAGLAQIEQALEAASKAYATAQASTDRAAIGAAGRDLRYWSGRRATARVVPVPTDHSEVRFGTSVTIVRDDGREQTFRIVGEDEADPSHGSISHVSPLARSMFGKRVGDVVHAGVGEAEIIRIR
jgi:transcription elongation GreA/GreB family factor